MTSEMQSTWTALPANGDWKLVGTGPALIQARNVGGVGLLVGDTKPTEPAGFTRLGQNTELATITLQANEKIWARALGGQDNNIDFTPQPNLRFQITKDGDNVTLGAKSDAPWDGQDANATMIALMKAVALFTGQSSGQAAKQPGSGYAASGVPVVAGNLTTATGAAAVTAPFKPLAGRSFNITVSGTFVGTVILERSFDSGATWFGLTSAGTKILNISLQSSEKWQDDEAGVWYRLRCSAFVSGPIVYRLSQ